MKTHVAKALDEELARRGLHLEYTSRDEKRKYSIVDDVHGLRRGWVALNGNFADAHPTCIGAYRNLAEHQPAVTDMLRVVSSHLDKDLQGQGLGRLLYEHAVVDLAHEGIAVAPDSCGNYGVTSKEAQRAWRSLARDYPAVPYAYRSDKPGAYPSAEGYVGVCRLGVDRNRRQRAYRAFDIARVHNQ